MFMRLRKNIICARAIYQEANHAFLRMPASRSDSGAKPDARAECWLQAHKGLSCLDKHAFPLWKSKREIVQGLWGARNKGVCQMEEVCRILGRHGEPTRRTHTRKEKQRWQLRSEKLQMGNVERASGQSPVSAYVLSAPPTANHAPIAENLFAWSASNTTPTAPALAQATPKNSALKLSKNWVNCGAYGVRIDDDVTTRPNERS